MVAHLRDRASFECDVLIGADGLHSRARMQLLNDGPPIDRGYLAWRGVMPYTPKSLTPATAIEIHGRGQRFGIGPVGFGRVGWWATANNSSGHASGPGVGGAPISSNAQQFVPIQDGATIRAELLRLFDGWCEPVLELIQETPLTSLVRNVVFDRLPVRKWGEGSMTLLGDAIHPTTPNLGQGGCLAIEDAEVLARCLHKYASDAGGAESRKSVAASQVSIALRRFESLRFRRTTAIARYSRIYGAVGQWENQWAVQMRSLLLSWIPGGLNERMLRALFSYDACAIPV